VRPYNVPFPKRVNNSSALSGISSMRGDYFVKPPLLEEVASRRLDGGVSGRTMFAPTMCLFQKGEQLLCPVGHLLYERRLFCKASSFRGGGKPQA
ncbi:hypothetical protein, partial [Ruminococcus sp.]|uniref:hypothetical protein n=1 Tax=Ruminococcus sp. TaxID=41978 RepID=UPI0040265718